MQLEPRVLENRFLRLEPFEEHHREGLRAACDADPALWRDLYILSWAGEQFEPTWTRFRADQAAGRVHPYAVIHEGQCVGLTCFMSIEQDQSVVEIGGTYYAPTARGVVVNPAAKHLMMGHAFASGARRVVYRVDAINARSRAAVLKLGATLEGILRQDKVTWTGRLRDTAVFSVLESEWPGVRGKLDARLSAFA